MSSQAISTQALPLIDPKQCAVKGHQETGTLSLKGLNLPEDIFANTDGQLEFSLKFGLDEEALIYIEGRLEAELALRCQRCLQPILHRLCSEFQLSPVRTDEEAQNLPERYEAVFMEGEKLSLLRLLEEELILSLPIAPSHEEPCSVAT